MGTLWKVNGNPRGTLLKHMGTLWELNGAAMGLNPERKVMGDEMHFFLKE